MLLRTLTLAFALLPLTALADDEVKCRDSGGQLELNACARDDYRKADKELNRAYKALILKESNDQLFVSKLRQAQKAWIAFRDAELAARFACADEDVRVCWGSMYPMSYLSNKAELTRERTKHLKRMLKEGHGE